VEPVVTRARHRSALERALAEVAAFHTARKSGVDAAAAATHLRAAVGALDDLIGVVTPDDVLDRVFASFCVGSSSPERSGASLLMFPIRAMFAAPSCREAPVARSGSAFRFATLGLVAVAACEYDTRVSPEPAAGSRSGVRRQSRHRDGPGANGRHIVTFRGQMPADFNAQVAKMGGKVLWASPGSRSPPRCAACQDRRPAGFVGKPGIEAVDADEVLTLDLPRLSGLSEAPADAVSSQAAPATAFFFRLQWNMRAVGADLAWATGHLGSSNVSVFILDSGNRLSEHRPQRARGRVPVGRSARHFRHAGGHQR